MEDVRRAYVNVTEDGMTPLMHACTEGDVDTVRVLVDASANVNVSDMNGITPLMYACTAGNVDIVRVLLNASAVVNAADLPRGTTPLMYACMQGNVDIVRVLLNASADVNATCKTGGTPLMYACQQGNVDIVRVLVSTSADVNAIDGWTPLMYASREKGNVDIVRLLLNASADVNATGNSSRTPIYFPCECKEGNVDIVRVLVDASANVNVSDKNGITPLMYACMQGHVDIVRVLLNASADVNATDKAGGTPLMYACQQGNVDIVRVLLNASADLSATNKDGMTPLMYACWMRYVDVVCVLVDAQADVNAASKNGSTPLFMALNDENITKILIENKADTEAEDQYGRTPLFHADGCNTLGLLLDAGANVNHKDENGNLVIFKWVDNEDVLRYLVENGADVNEFNNKRETALFLTSNPATARFLIQKGANVCHHDMLGRTAMYHAFETGFELVKVLLENGARLHLTDMYETIVKWLMDDSDFAKFEKLLLVEKNDQLRIISRELLKRNIVNVALCVLLKMKLRKAPFPCEPSHVLQKAITLFDPQQGGSMGDESVSVYRVCKYLLDIGADPNAPDPDGNTALFYAVLCTLKDDVLPADRFAVCRLLIDYGSSTSVQNHKGETALLFLLNSCIDDSLESYGCGIHPIADVCKLLLDAGTPPNATTNTGQGVYHLIMRICEKVLGGAYAKMKCACIIKHIQTTLQVLSSSTSHLLLVNTPDKHLNTPLHLWASLECGRSTSLGFNDFSEFLSATFKHLQDGGAKLNHVNDMDETPLHLCQTWSAAKLLLEAGADPRVVNGRGDSPLIAHLKRVEPLSKTMTSARQLLKEIYPDTQELEPDQFWKVALRYNLDPWITNNGVSVLGILLSLQEFELTNSLIKVSMSNKCIDGTSALLEICKDPGTETNWKALLVEKLLQSGVSPKTMDSTPLYMSCKNAINSDTEDNVHYAIVKRLCFYADYNIKDASVATCLEMASESPKLKHCLQNPMDTREILKAIPWTTKSERFRSKLEEVARKRKSKQHGDLYYHEKEIGSGAFGMVYAGINSKEGREVAIKCISKEKIKRPEDRKEIVTLIKLEDCPQVVRYHSFVEDQRDVYIVMELMEGDLDQFLDRHDPTYDSSLLCGHIVQGMQFLHGKGILHRDVKPGNILYKLSPLCFKIADFGLSRESDLQSTMTTNVGTRGWMAPEVMKGKSVGSIKHTKCSDMFACALVVHYFLSGKKHPFAPTDCTDKSDEQILIETQKNILDFRPSIGDCLSPEAIHLVERMIAENKDERITATDALAHPFFWSSDKKVQFLRAVGNQPEISVRSHSVVVIDLETSFGRHCGTTPWYNLIPAYIYHEMTSSPRGRKYDITSCVQLLRFIRNAYAHVSEVTRSSLFQTDLCEKYVFFDCFPWLVIEAYKAVTKAGWHTPPGIRKEVNAVLKSE